MCFVFMQVYCANYVSALTLSNRMTLLQQRPSGFPPISGEEKPFSKSTWIDLGSRYASQLGFDGMKLYEEHDVSALAENTATSSKKKKKKRKKKKGGEEKEVEDKGDDERAMASTGSCLKRELN